MSRLPPLIYEELTSEQQKAYQMIAGPRDGVVNGPFPAWIRTPELCERIQGVSDILRTKTNLKKYMFEMITLVVARKLNAGYMWGAHSGFAVRDGLPQSIIDDINLGRKPVFEDQSDQVIFDVADYLAASKQLPQDVYDRAAALLGIDLLIEVSTDVGFYIMIATVLNTFNVLPTEGTLPLA